MFKISKPLLLLSILCSTSVYADGNYLSLGVTNVSSAGESATGFGASWAYFGGESNQLGFITTASYASKDFTVANNWFAANATINAFDINMGPIFKVPNTEWLRIYPLVGFTFAEVNACASNTSSSACAKDNETYFNYGVGIQASIPQTNFFGDINIKKVSGDADATIWYFGAGYHF